MINILFFSDSATYIRLFQGENIFGDKGFELCVSMYEHLFPSAVSFDSLIFLLYPQIETANTI